MKNTKKRSMTSVAHKSSEVTVPLSQLFLSHFCPKSPWDTQLTIFIGVTAVFALCPTIFEKNATLYYNSISPMNSEVTMKHSSGTR